MGFELKRDTISNATLCKAKRENRCLMGDHDTQKKIEIELKKNTSFTGRSTKLHIQRFFPANTLREVIQRRVQQGKEKTLGTKVRNPSNYDSSNRAPTKPARSWITTKPRL